MKVLVETDLLKGYTTAWTIKSVDNVLKRLMKTHLTTYPDFNKNKKLLMEGIELDFYIIDNDDEELSKILVITSVKKDV
jgi:hypothetical protein